MLDQGLQELESILVSGAPVLEESDQKLDRILRLRHSPGHVDGGVDQRSLGPAPSEQLFEPAAVRSRQLVEKRGLVLFQRAYIRLLNPRLDALLGNANDCGVMRLTRAVLQQSEK